MPSNVGVGGIDVRQTGTALIIRALLQNASGGLVTSGSTVASLYEVQSDGSLKSYDWSSNTFKTTILTTETQALTHQTGNAGNTNTGIWTYALATLTGFTIGAVYLVRINNASAAPTDQYREFQYGGQQGDLATTQGATGVGYAQSDLREWLGTAPLVLSSQLVQATASISGTVAANVTQWNGTNVPAPATAGIPDVNAKNIGGQAAALDANNLLKVDVEDWHAVAIATTVPAAASADFNTTQKTSLNAATPASIQSVSNIVNGGAINTSSGKVSEVALVDTLTTYTSNTPQTGDAYALIGAAGAGLTALGDTRIAHLDADTSSRAPAATALSTATWTSTRAGYLDNLSGGAVALESESVFIYNAVVALGSPAQAGSAPSWYVGPDNTDIAAIKVQTDKLGFDGSNNVKSTPQTAVALTAAGLDEVILFGALNARQGLAGCLLFLAGATSGVGTTSIVVSLPTIGSTGTPSFSVTTDAGQINRIAVTYTPPA